MFSGQGSQYINMGLGLYETEPLFRRKIDEYSEILKPHLFLDLRTILYPGNKNPESAHELLKQTRYTQPAIFAIELALANLWIEWGIMPKAMVGHSIGEYTAACLSGVFTVEDALSIIHYRGRLMQKMPEGSMLTIPLPEDEIQPYLNDKITLAVINNPELCTVAGDPLSIDQLEKHLEDAGIRSHRLHTSHAFHSVMMEPMITPFIEKFSNISLHEPQIPFVSNVTGTWITPDEATDPRYWASQLRNTVRFSDCLEELFKTPDQIYLEIGPGRTLSTLTNQHPKKPHGTIALGSLRHPKESESDVAYILNTLGRFWISGKKIDWIKYYKNEKRHRISLPTYPFERKRYWIDPVAQKRNYSDLFTKQPIDQVQSAQDQTEQTPEVPESHPDSPRDDVEKRLAAIWDGLLGVGNLSIHDNFFEIGGSSLTALSLFAQINKTFGKNLSLATLFEAPTIELLANILREGDLQTSWSPLVEIQAGGSKTPFFLIHAEDGNVVAYRDLANYLDKDQPVYGLQAKELSGEQVVSQKLEDIAAVYVREVRRIQPHGPYILGGFCLGGCLAYEMAQQIQKLGDEVALTVMIQARHRDYRKYLPSSTRLHRHYFRIVDRLDYEFNNLSKLGYKDKFSYIRQRIDRVVEEVRIRISRNHESLSNKIQKNFPQTMAYTYANVAKKFNNAFWNYYPRPYNGRVVIFRASEQPHGIYPDPTLGWGELIKGEVELYEIPAYHQTIIQEPQAQLLGELLNKCLNTTDNLDT
jgi:acyl transferase domain-containing protein